MWCKIKKRPCLPKPLERIAKAEVNVQRQRLLLSENVALKVEKEAVKPIGRVGAGSAKCKRFTPRRERQRKTAFSTAPYLFLSLPWSKNLPHVSRIMHTSLMLQ